MEVKPLSAMKTIRLERKLKRYEVAEAIGVSDKTLGRWEEGETSPTLTEAMPLARHYGVRLDQLVDGAVTPVAG